MRTLSFADEPGSRAPRVAAPALVLVMDCAHPLEAPQYIDLNATDEVLIGRGTERGFEHTRNDDRGHLHVALADRWLSTQHVHLVRETDTWYLRDFGSKNGTWVNGQKITDIELHDEDLIEVGHTFFLFRVNADRTASPGDRQDVPDGLVTLNPQLAATFLHLPRLARANLPIVITGETGTGKEVMARAVHQMSDRSGEFLALNCGALPDTIIESELFGAEKGAFSGAVKSRTGLVRAADGGTLFLDEIAELPASSQAVLLRVLQEGEVLPVGATTPIKVDVRVLAATHQDLDARVEAGEFRRDLLARLRGFALHLPPLRERREDLGTLIAALLVRIAGDRESATRFTRQAARQLCLNHWPMNVRELEQVLRAALVMADGAEIDIAHLPAAITEPSPLHSGAAPVATSTSGQSPRAQSPSPAAPAQVTSIRASDPDAAERLLALARAHSGNIAAIARALGTSRSQVRRLLARHDIDPRSLS